MSEKERFDAMAERLGAIKERVGSAQAQFSGNQMMDPFSEAAEYVGQLGAAVMDAEALKRDVERELEKMKGQGANGRASKRAAPYRQLHESVTVYLESLRRERDWERRRLEEIAPAGDDGDAG